jgi:hypothetical protein
MKKAIKLLKNKLPSKSFPEKTMAVKIITFLIH